MQYIKLKALAKINLGLDVLGKRENGYHDVRMVMQTITLHDKIKITKIESDKVEVRSNLYYLPNNENNIAYKAAQMLRDEFNIKEGVRIRLDKQIPVAAGMAGGSANAAAVLKGMNRLFNLRLNQQELMDRGVQLGADVPYCIMQGTVLAEGIGEELTELAPMPKCHIVIAKPPISVSTKRVYEALDAKSIVEHPSIDAVVGGLEFSNIEAVAKNMGNVLEDVTIPEYPIVQDIKDVMLKGGAINAMMSGSGPTVFGIFAREADAKRTMRLLREAKLSKQVYLCRPFNITRR